MLFRSGKLILDEADTYGVEMGLQLVEKAGGGEVTIVSMGSAADVSGIRTALAMGAAKAVVVSDDSLRGTDALGTAKVLAAAIKRINPDLVLCATESSDGYTGTTPVQVAEILGLPAVTFAKSVTSGYQPLGGVLVGPAVHQPLAADPNFILRTGFTYSGHPVSCAVALANIELMEREGIVDHDPASRLYRLHDSEAVSSRLALYRARFPDMLASAAEEMFDLTGL